MCRPSSRSLIEWAITIIYNDTVGHCEDRRSGIDLAIIREDLSRPQMFLRWVDGKAQVADPTSRKARTGKGTESQVTIKVAEACGRNVDVCDHNDNHDLT